MARVVSKPRQFKLINGQGNTWDLMSKQSLFINPQGLGYELSTDYLRVGSVYELIESFANQKEVSGEMVFANYEVYKNFTEFVNIAPLRLGYMPLEEWAYMDVLMTSIDKSEIQYDGSRLICPVKFTGSSKWYIPRTAKRTSDDVDNPKKYDYSYDYQYADELNGVIRINNQSSEESPVIITIFGNIENPAWYLTVNNKQIASGEVNAIIPADHKLVVNSNDGELEVAEYVSETDEFVRNLYQYVDFDRETFIDVPQGNSVITITGNTGGSSISAMVEVKELHETI